jgi:hypothetical protein
VSLWRTKRAWIETGGILQPTTAFGASRPFRRIPAIVSFLSPQPALSLGGVSRSSCPQADTHDHPHERLGWVVSGSSEDAGLAVLTALFDHPVRAGEDRGRDINAERLPGL